MATERMFAHQRADVAFRDVPLAGYARNLEFRGGWRYFGVEAGAFESSRNSRLKISIQIREKWSISSTTPITSANLF